MKKEEKESYFCETVTVYGRSEQIGIHALASAANSLAAAGALCLEARVKITYPNHAEKSGIYAIKKRIEKICREKGIRLREMSLLPNPLVRVPAVTVTASGRVEDEQREPVSQREEACPKGMMDAGDIVLMKWVGMDGMLQILAEKERELSTHFAASFLEQIRSFADQLFCKKEISLAKEFGAGKIVQMGEGGIFAALWQLSLQHNAGFEVDLKKMSVLQETIEVCEYFRLNPYQLTSAGSFLMVGDNGELLAEKLCQEGIYASVLGRMTGKRDKIIRNGEDIRYLDRPASDEIYKIYDERQDLS